MCPCETSAILVEADPRAEHTVGGTAHVSEALNEWRKTASILEVVRKRDGFHNEDHHDAADFQPLVGVREVEFAGRMNVDR